MINKCQIHMYIKIGTWHHETKTDIFDMLRLGHMSYPCCVLETCDDSEVKRPQRHSWWILPPRCWVLGIPRKVWFQVVFLFESLQALHLGLSIPNGGPMWGWLHIARDHSHACTRSASNLPAVTVGSARVKFSRTLKIHENPDEARYQKLRFCPAQLKHPPQAGMTLPNLTESLREMLDEFMKRVLERHPEADTWNL